MIHVRRGRDPHRHYHDHLPWKHEAELFAHGYVAGVLNVSLLVRLVQLTFDMTLWLLVPLTSWWSSRRTGC